VFLNGNQQDRAPLKLIFERLRDRMDVQFSQLFFILIGLFENALHEKLSRTPFTNPNQKILMVKGFFLAF